MWRFLIISTIVVVSTSLTAGLDVPDAVDVLFRENRGTRFISYREGMTSIGPGAINIPTATELVIITEDIVSCIYGESKNISITPESFQVLPAVTSVSVTCVNLQGARNLFKNLHSLKELALSGNKLTEVPQELCADIPNLKRLIVKMQHIKTVSPASFSTVTQGIEFLRLNNNEMEFIQPHSFKRLHHLNSLDLKKNQLMSISPDTFDGLNQLTILDLSENHLKKIISGTFSDLKNLQKINLEKNQLESLPDGIFNQLEHLTSLKLLGNVLSTMPNNFLRRPNKLVELSLGFNEKVDIEANAFNGLNLKSFRLTADELKLLKSAAFSGLSTENLVFFRNDGIDFNANLFRGVKAQKVYIYEKNMTTIDRQRWGLGEQVPIYSLTQPNPDDPFNYKTTQY